MKRHAALVLALVLLAACSGGDDTASDAPAGDDGEIDVSMVDIGYEPDQVTIPADTTLTVHLSNDGAIEHDFQLEDGTGSDMLAPGDSTTLEIGPFTESTVAWCTVPGHREAGMEFTIDVE